jgi:diguanylate cyclase (GGDEF)-like protein
MIAMDNFKSINATYGHDCADNAIIHISEIIRSELQYHDIVARFEGEEFCVVLKDTGRENGMDVLEHLRQKIACTPLINTQGEEIFVSVSIGAIVQHEDSFTETINEADAQLYQAKTAGGNKLCVI